MKNQGKYTVILGGGLTGCMAALQAKRRGLFPIIVERRPFLGFEISGRHQLFMAENRWEELCSNDMLGLSGTLVQNEVCFFQGEVKTHLMKLMREEQIPCLLLSHLAGVFTDEKSNAAGVLLANSYGTFHLPAAHVLDCSGDGLLRNMICGTQEDSDITKISYAMELEGPKWSLPVIELDAIDGWDGRLCVHHSKRGSDTALISFDISCVGPIAFPFARSMWENKAKSIAIEVIAQLRREPGMQDIRIINLAYEVGVVPKYGFNDFSVNNVWESRHALEFGFGAPEILDGQEKTAEMIEQLHTRDAENTAAFLYINGTKADAAQVLPIQNSSAPEWMGVTLQPVSIGIENLPSIGTDILIAGLGTAGMAALEGSGESEHVLAVEGQYILGGTRTSGHVMNYYFGRRGGFTALLDDRLQRFDREVLLTPPKSKQKFERTSLVLMHHRQADQIPSKILLGSVVCGVFMQSNCLSGVIAVNEHGIFCIQAKVSIDATGNGDVASLAGAEFLFGDPEDGNCQTFSQWGVEEREPKDFQMRRYAGDFDSVDPTSYSDMLRAMTLAQTQGNSAYYFSNYVSYREGRRIIGRDYLTIERAITFRDIKKPILAGECTIDNHGRTSAAFSRMGYGAIDRVFKGAVPLDCFIPKGIDGLLVGGKAFSADRDAMGIMRMNADTQNAGYALGIIAGMTKGGKLGDIDYDSLRPVLERNDLLPEEYLHSNIPNAENAVRNICQQDGYGLFNVILQEEHEVLPLLKEEYSKAVNEGRKYLLAKALAWFCDDSGIDLLRSRLEYLAANEKKDPLCDIDTKMDLVRHGIGSDVNDYWELNQLIELSSRIGSDTFTDILCKIINTAEAGGAPYVSRYPYYASRADMVCIPYYERIYNLAYVFLHSPSPKAAQPLIGLLQKTYIGGRYYAKKAEESPLFFSSYLELTIARAAYRCGATEARDIIIEYSRDVRLVLAKCARRELADNKNSNIGINL